jgi:hypothetical protein
VVIGHDGIYPFCAPTRCARTLRISNKPIIALEICFADQLAGVGRRLGDIWRRARAALCPEAGPSCKDPSRQYYLPSHSGRNAALNGAAWTLGRWIAAGALEQADVEDELYGAAEANSLIADDGQRQCWATIRSGLGAGLQQPIDLGADDRPPARRGRGRL